MKNKNVLVIAAHPDDELLGCGGTVARLVAERRNVYACILSKGIASRHENPDDSGCRREKAELDTQMRSAARLIGTKGLFVEDFPDNSFDSVPLIRIVKAIEKVLREIKPEIVFTHFEEDLNIDHQIAYRATITAARPLKESPTMRIYSYETVSSTEWAYPTSFSPNVFFDITKTIDKKLKALAKYGSEMRKGPHPRSLEHIRKNAEVWGAKIGVEAAEAFYCVREVI